MNDSREERLRMAFHFMGGGLWTAGSVYLQDLFHALKDVHGDRMRLVLVAEETTNGDRFDGGAIRADEIVTYRQPRRWSPAWAAHRAAEQWLSLNGPLLQALHDQGLALLFGPVLAHRYPGVKTLSYIPDFQHRHLPDMFSEDEIRARDVLFARCAERTSRIILPTDAARTDFERFAPRQAHKARVLHPLAVIPPELYRDVPKAAAAAYNLPEKFFFVPNQWFRHKNHETVFEALRILKSRGSGVVAVFCGNPVDYRHPRYFPEMWRRVSEMDIRDRVIYLGMVPRDHLLMLMRQSICVVNPSLFEGWGMTVDEARSIGKRLLVSDIPAHRFQDPPDAVYFNPEDPEALAGQMAGIWSETGPGPDIRMEEEARQTYPRRIRSFAETFLTIVREVQEEASAG
jgi:glycosyltransferase involved in cell wall biosynthesis